MRSLCWMVSCILRSLLEASCLHLLPWSRRHRLGHHRLPRHCLRAILPFLGEIADSKRCSLVISVPSLPLALMTMRASSCTRWLAVAGVDLDLRLARDSVLSLGGLPRPRSATPGVESRVILHFKFVVWLFLKALSATTVNHGVVSINYSLSRSRLIDPVLSHAQIHGDDRRH